MKQAGALRGVSFRQVKLLQLLSERLEINNIISPTAGKFISSLENVSSPLQLMKMCKREVKFTWTQAKIDLRFSGLVLA